MADILQRFLDAEGARIGLAACGARLILRPVGKLAGRKTAHAGDLIGEDFGGSFGRHKNQGAVGRAHRLGEALLDPALRMHEVAGRQINRLADGADLETASVCSPICSTA